MTPPSCSEMPKKDPALGLQAPGGVKAPLRSRRWDHPELGHQHDGSVLSPCNKPPGSTSSSGDPLYSGV